MAAARAGDESAFASLAERYQRNFARTWAGELAGRGIRVNTVSTGPIETPGPESPGWRGHHPGGAVPGVQGRPGANGPPGAAGGGGVGRAVPRHGGEQLVTGAEIFVDGGLTQVWSAGR